MRAAFLTPIKEAPAEWRASAVAVRIVAASAAVFAAWLLVAGILTLVAAIRIAAGSAAVSGAGHVIVGIAYALGLLAAAAGALLALLALHRLAQQVWAGDGHAVRLGAFFLLVIALVAPAVTVGLFVLDVGVWFFATVAIPLGITALALPLVIASIMWLLSP